MNMNPYELLALFAATLAILALGSTQLRPAIGFYALHTLMLGLATIYIGLRSNETQLLAVAAAVILIKSISVPIFLNWIVKKLDLSSDSGMYIAAPISMHLAVILLALAYLLSKQIPGLHGLGDCRSATTAAMSILFSGVLLMLTRKLAISQILGFLFLENGIYLFALAQTRGMPLIVEMGLLLEVLVGVMISGLLLFRIKKSFEHIDSSQLNALQEIEEN